MYTRFYEAPYPHKTLLPQQHLYPEDIQCIIDPVDGIGGIYISNLEAAQNIRTLNRHKIKAVLTAASGVQINHSKAQIPHYKYVPGVDHQTFDLSQYFQESIKFIDDKLNQTNVLVHCMAGISRSVTLVLAYLIKYKGYSYESSYNLIKSRRKIIHPNDGFIMQLKKFEREIKHSGSYDSNLVKDSRRYQTPGKSQFQYNMGNPGYELRESTQNLSRNRAQSSYTQLKQSRYQKKQSFQNQAQLDRKIQQIRKKYENLTDSYYNTANREKVYSSYKQKIKHSNSYYENPENLNFTSKLKKRQAIYENAEPLYSQITSKYDTKYQSKYENIVPSAYDSRTRLSLRKTNTLNDYRHLSGKQSIIS